MLSIKDPRPARVNKEVLLRVSEGMRHETGTALRSETDATTADNALQELAR